MPTWGAWLLGIAVYFAVGIVVTALCKMLSDDPAGDEATLGLGVLFWPILLGVAVFWGLFCLLGALSMLLADVIKEKVNGLRRTTGS
jgi:hypothetical protein